MKTFLRDYLMLTTVFTVGLTVFVFFTHSTKGFELFIGELTSHGVSKKRLATYLLALFLGLLAVELFCRKFVQQNDQGRFTKPAYILCVVPYALYYGRFGLVMLPLALAFSLLLIVYYHKYKHFKTLFFWQYSIQVALLPLCMLIAIFFDGQIREIFLFEYKKMHIERENLTYREGWGWVDKVHYRDDHYRYLKAQVDAAKPGERIVLSLHDAWHTPLKIYVQVKRSYDVDVPDTPELRWAVVAGIMLDFMTLSEQTQADSPWYHGNQLSAWQFDDMASALLASLDSAPDSIKPKFGKDVFDKKRLQELWLQEGRGQIARKVHQEDLWQDYPLAKGLRSIVHQGRLSWVVKKSTEKQGH